MRKKGPLVFVIVTFTLWKVSTPQPCLSFWDMKPPELWNNRKSSELRFPWRPRYLLPIGLLWSVQTLHHWASGVMLGTAWYVVRMNTTSEPGRRISNPVCEPRRYAEMMLVHENSLVKIEQDIGFEQMALIGCGATTGLGAAMNTAKVEPGSTVAVIGCGGVGLKPSKAQNLQVP
ncbi:MAG: hypothetical protein Ct9H300mP11_17250 [Chloroflexota bacterium]|nr:MAG: hypothetical protein Ct9H300mP11_17250 [Chloroflexota bacterium]